MTRLVLLLAVLAAPVAAQTQADLNAQAGADMRRADAALNARYRALATQLKDDRVEGAALVTAQRAWITFRDAHCTLAGYEFRGGSAEGMARATCLAAVTRARTAQLAQLGRSLAPK